MKNTKPDSNEVTEILIPTLNESETDDQLEIVNSEILLTTENQKYSETNSSKDQADKNKDLEAIFNSIEEAFNKDKIIMSYIFPHPRGWLGPRFMAIWTVPILIIRRLRDLMQRSNPVKLYSESNYAVLKAETIYTSTKNALEGEDSIRFFGPRFLVIWVLPFAITGLVIDYLFIAPLNGPSLFG